MTPNDPEFWPASMTRGGATATREQMVQAWRRWREPRDLRDMPFLSLMLWRANVRHADRVKWPDHLAKAMIQRARKTGHIHYDGREWREGPGE